MSIKSNLYLSIILMVYGCSIQNNGRAIKVPDLALKLVITNNYLKIDSKSIESLKAHRFYMSFYNAYEVWQQDTSEYFLIDTSNVNNFILMNELSYFKIDSNSLNVIVSLQNSQENSLNHLDYKYLGSEIIDKGSLKWIESHWSKPGKNIVYRYVTYKGKTSYIEMRSETASDQLDFRLIK